MKPLRWTAAYALGLVEVDIEHRGLFAALSDLSDAVKRNDWSTAREMLRVVPADATKHFRHEERLMRHAGYAGYAWHRKQHTTARNRLMALVQAALQGGIGECDGVLAYLREWLPYHLMLHDRMMAAGVRNFRRANFANRRNGFRAAISQTPNRRICP
jgi:hemerythrin